MLVTLICPERLYALLLPTVVSGQYWITDAEKEISDEKRKLINIEAENGKWVIRGSRKRRLYDEDKKPTDCLVLDINRFYKVEFGENQTGFLYTEAYSNDHCTYQKYLVERDRVITIGKAAENHIRIRNHYVSSLHAQISFANGKWTVIDNRSNNGVYVNEKRVRDAKALAYGDVIYIFGVKIIVGNAFIAINNPEHTVSVQSNALKELRMEQGGTYEPPEEPAESFYYRSPQFRREASALELRIDAPTNREHLDEISLVMSMAPSLVMGAASFTSGIIAVYNTVSSGGKIIAALPSVLMSVSMLAGMIIFPSIMKTGDKKRKRARELERREKYLKYLDNIRKELAKAGAAQADVLKENYPDIIGEIKKESFFEQFLWGRIIGHDDFLTFRIGMGNIPLLADLSFPDERFSIDDDIMRDEVNLLKDEKKMILGVPVSFSAVKSRISGIVGNKSAVNGLLNAIFLQAAAYHSYDELKIVFLCEQKDFNQYGYIRWTKHLWDNALQKRFMATTHDEVRELSAYFLRVIAARKDNPKQDFPHYLVVSTSRALSDKCAFLTEILADNSIAGFSYLAVYDEFKNLPKECDVVIQLKEKQGMIYDRENPGGEPIIFVQDTVSGGTAKEAVMKIGTYKLDLSKGKYVLPNAISFLDMYQVSKYEHLNILTRWKENNPVLTLQVPIGINSDGGLFYLDIHEKAHGPHGLIAGMTGSGKSEFIISYILSLAVNYSPNDVAFILIDYKGGGLTGAFENESYRLPHLAGTITNLDGAMITRSLLSIQSELRRRQAVFNEARRISGEATMDIYKYQKLYRDGLVGEPMPHLLIISDEFAELKEQQPEFMTQLISTARIGRSLGVHLILATQKPNGVVNEQIWANSKFKVCLKVQDRADSMDMLKRPDAAELVETGRFYLQVGYNEMFEMGQSAWSGAAYTPQKQVENRNDKRVELIDYLGNVIEEAKLRQKAAGHDKEEKRRQIVEIVKYICELARAGHLQAPPLWLAELGKVITVASLAEKYGYQCSGKLNPIVGELDDPFNQRQALLTLPITDKGNVIIYGVAGSGKELFLTTMLFALYQYYPADCLNAYILDFGAETLRMFQNAPQTGGVVLSDENEKLDSLFKLLLKEAEYRKKLMAESGSDFTAYRDAVGNMPYIVVVINNYLGFSEQYELYDEMVSSMSRECTKYGIYFVITSVSVSGIRHKMLQNFAQVFALQLNDKSDYVSVLGTTKGVYPSAVTGRGIYRDTEVYEFQTAYADSDTRNLADKVRAFCDGLSQQSSIRARQIPMMPKVVKKENLREPCARFDRLSIGMNYNTFETRYLDLRKYGTLQLLAMENTGFVHFAEGIIRLIAGQGECELYIFDSDKMVKARTGGKVHYITDNFEERVVELFKMTVERHNFLKKQETEHAGQQMDMCPVIVLIMGYGKLAENLTDDGADKLKLILEKSSGRFYQSCLVFDEYRYSYGYSTQKWCSGNGIWVGPGIEEQSGFTINRRQLDKSKAAEMHTAYMIERGAFAMLKLVVSDEYQEEG